MHDKLYLFEDAFKNTYTMKKLLLLTLTILTGIQLYAQSPELWGMTSAGGSGLGVLFEYTPVTNNYQKELDFNGASNGSSPSGSLMQASNGKLYGMTHLGGANGLGVLFEYNPATGTYTKKLDFNGAANGSYPQGSLMQASNGLLYGMTSQGGANGMGVLFEYNPATSTYTKKLDFNGATNGSNPYGSLMQASNGLLYGMAYSGGANGMGVLFEYNPATGTYTKKFDFNGAANGSYPLGSLMQASNGLLYGMTRLGGANGLGVLFEYNPTTGTYTKKLDFNGATNGSNPYGSLMQAPNGLLYGMTTNGGTSSGGVLFEYNPATSTYTKKLDFNGPNGSYPRGSLMQASNGLLYGMTLNGGANGFGVLLEYNPATSTYTKKFDFNFANGIYPYGDLIEINVCTPNTGTDVITSCDSYTWPANNTNYTSSGVHTATLTNINGCDSVVTLNLTINYANTGSQTTTSCDSYTWPANNTNYTSSGTYTATLTNINGCDSVVTLNLTINYANTGSQTTTSCDSYTWPANNTNYTSSGIYTATLTNINGCDSVVTLNLTINYANTGSQTTTSCDSYTWPANNTNYTSSGIYTATLTNINGCDSVVTLNLTINNANTGTHAFTACKSYTSPSGNYTWTVSGNYLDTIPNYLGCDSVITINLTINTVDTSVTVSNNTLIANANTAIYEWVDCNNNYAAIPGETNQTFTPSINGTYAVVVTQNNCTDTSACYTIGNVGLSEHSASNIKIYPNPTRGMLHVETKQLHTIELYNSVGKIVYVTQIKEGHNNLQLPDLAAGVYIIKLYNGTETFVERLVIHP
jgi:uncharacterized repeat protein (TIGR03803 family)